MLYTLVDIETNGMSHTTNDILEVGYIQMKRNMEIVRSGTLYFWKDGWGVGRGDIHHLSSSFLSQYKDDFDANLVRLITLIHKGIIFGKNSNGFDIPFIRSFILKYGYGLSVQPAGVLDIQDWLALHYRNWAINNGIQVSPQKKGTLSEYMDMIGKSQDEIMAEFRQKFPDEARVRAHSALYDVYMTYLAFDYAVKELGMKL